MSDAHPELAASGATESVHDALNRQTRQLHALMEIGQALSAATSVDALLQRVADESRALVGARLCTISLATPDREGLELRAISGNREHWEPGQIIPLHQSLTGVAVRERRTLWIEDVQRDDRYQQGNLARAENLRGVLVEPIAYEADVMGTINLYPDGGEPGQTERNLLAALASQAAVAITSAQRLEQVLRTEGLLRQTERMALLGMMSAELAHEVRNPITVVTMLLHALGEDPALAPHLRDDVELAIEKLREIESIVSRTLGVAQGDRQAGQSVKLPGLADHVIELLEPHLKKHGVRAERDYVNSMPPVPGDEGQLRQVMLNLLLNAIEALRANDAEGAEKSVRISLHETARDGQAGVEITVRDSGPGMPGDLLDSAFDPFVTRRSQGTGLGLYISAKIVAKHLGAIRCQNNAGARGCSVIIWLPSYDFMKDDEGAG